jgi:hypothetical protein
MTAVIRIKAIIPKRGLSKLKLKVLEKELQDLVKDETDIHEQIMDGVTQHWRRRFKFNKKSGVGPRKGYYSLLWSGYRRLIWTDQGTRRRPVAITPGFQSKTTPGSLQGGPGRPARRVILLRRGGGTLWGKGVKPRYFFKAIVAHRQDKFTLKATEAITRGLRRAL